MAAESAPAAQLIPVVLSGGSGTRLWPSSRSMYPKQLLALAERRTMLQATALRTRGLDRPGGRCVVVCNESHRFLVAEQLAAIEMDASIILEPAGRNTAPAVALAAFQAASDNPDALLLVMPADHVIEDVTAFQAAVSAAVAAAAAGKLVTFGIVPSRPETGFGYLRAELDGDSAVAVESFVEKPDAGTAESYVADGRHFWNSGMFLFQASSYLRALERLAPDMHSACDRSMRAARPDGQFLRPERETFLDCPSDSIDYAVMEKVGNAVMVPLNAGWSDVGSWSALHDVMLTDDAGNAIDGDVVLHDCRDTFVQAESRLVGVVGLQDIVVVETKDSVLVADKRQSQDVKELVRQLKEQQRPETELHRQVFRPWGSFDSLENAENFQVKRLIVKPGAVLSLQKHAHRSEHWVVVRGRIRITKNDDVFDLGVNESTYVAIGDVHRIANPFDEPAHVIEVQCGDYLGEDDIIRIEDNYGRERTNN
ncbi:MAG: mannose-1-phosphate guanylyltransferase/mannose-6-phosphate isomerase [Gammaproteobacteria bacterium]|nr:mannose-1-phosphate guanylyltransferase/mannose-6-phosphate isomerase [Gammaproteobacteria bacterium]